MSKVLLDTDILSEILFEEVRSAGYDLHIDNWRAT